jgi:hypothetical protein
MKGNRISIGSYSSSTPSKLIPSQAEFTSAPACPSQRGMLRLAIANLPVDSDPMFADSIFVEMFAASRRAAGIALTRCG